MDAERRAFFAGTMRYNVSEQDGAISGNFRPVPIWKACVKWFLDKTREICTKTGEFQGKGSCQRDRQGERNILNENFRRDISLDDVSREVDISPYYFSKLFKQETGKNFIEYLTEIRLKNARELLQDSQTFH